MSFRQAANISLGAGQGFGLVDIQRLKAMGFDAIRIPAYWGRFQPNNAIDVDQTPFTTSIGPANTVGLDQYVAWATSENMKVIIPLAWSDSFPPPTWAFAGLTTLYARTEKLLQTGSHEADGYINTWRAIANRYRGKQNVIFEIINEPGISDKTSQYPTLYADLCERIYDAMNCTNLVLVSILRAGDAWEEVVDEQPQIMRNVGYSTHRYEPFGDYDPAAQAYAFDYSTNAYGWVTLDKYILWRIKRCSDKIKGWGAKEYNTEFGKSINSLNYAAWLNTVMTINREQGLVGWTVHEYNSEGGDFSIVNADGTPTPIYDIVKQYMTAAPAMPADNGKTILLIGAILLAIGIIISMKEGD